MTRYDLNGNPIDEGPAQAGPDHGSAKTASVDAPLQRPLTSAASPPCEVAPHGSYAPPGSVAYPTRDPNGSSNLPPSTYGLPPQDNGWRGRTAADMVETTRKAGIGIGTFLSVALVVTYAAMAHPLRIAAPSAYVEKETVDGLAYVSPAGWQRGLSQHTSPTELTYTIELNMHHLSAEVNMNEQLVPPQPELALGQPLSPEDDKAVHSRAADAIGGSSKDFGVDYREFHESTPRTFDTQFGLGEITEWTARGNVNDLPRMVHGFRAVIIGSSKVVTLDSDCLEEDWATLRPTFLYMFEHVKDGAPK